MKQTYCAWKDEEVKKLFNFVEQEKLKNKSLCDIFKNYALISSRKPHSVRNYYYAELKFLEQNNDKATRLNIDLAKHTKCEQKAFSDSETKQVLINLLKLTQKGYSVRKACFELSGGNITNMVRYQNKYRTVLVKQPELLQECKQELNIESTAQKNNVIKMKAKSSHLADGEINSLFLGLVKLVKKQAYEEASCALKNENIKASESLRKTLVELANKENELKKLRESFSVLEQKNEELDKKLACLISQKAESLKSQFNKTQKMKKLMEYNSKINENKVNAKIN